MSGERTAVIVGASGQDGRLLTESLIADGCRVVGVGREGFIDTGGSKADLTEACEIMRRVAPDELYYLAAYHHSSEDKVVDTPSRLLAASHQVHVALYTEYLDAIHTLALPTKVFYAASSHIFGWPDTLPQNESTVYDPQCAYGITKVQGIYTGRYYRREFGMHVSSGILFNHESSHRRSGFVTRKIVEGAVAIALGTVDTLELGDLSVMIDWGYAPDYVDAMHRILNDSPGDEFIVATGERHSVEEFVRIAFDEAGVTAWQEHVKVNPKLITKRMRNLMGDSTKLRTMTGWKPTIGFEQMVRRLVQEQMTSQST